MRDRTTCRTDDQPGVVSIRKVRQDRVSLLAGMGADGRHPQDGHTHEGSVAEDAVHHFCEEPRQWTGQPRHPLATGPTRSNHYARVSRHGLYIGAVPLSTRPSFQVGGAIILVDPPRAHGTCTAAVVRQVIVDDGSKQVRTQLPRSPATTSSPR